MTTGKTKQDYITPMPLIRLIERAYGLRFVIDLSASPENARCPSYFTKEFDALSQDWVDAIEIASALHVKENGDQMVCAAWLNPEFKQGSEFMRKCAEESKRGAVIVSLTLASVGSVWYQEYVSPNAESKITDRIIFEGQPMPFNRDTMLTFWGLGRRGLGWVNLKRLAEVYGDE